MADQDERPTPPQEPRKQEQQKRQERLARALRENLRRRKAPESEA